MTVPSVSAAQLYRFRRRNRVVAMRLEPCSVPLRDRAGLGLIKSDSSFERTPHRTARTEDAIFFLSSPRRPLSHTAPGRRGKAHGGGTWSRVLQQCPVVERRRVSFFPLSLSSSFSLPLRLMQLRALRGFPPSVDFSRPRRLSKVTFAYTTRARGERSRAVGALGRTVSEA